MADAHIHNHARAGRGGIKAVFLAQASGILAVETGPRGEVARVKIRPEAALAAELITIEDEALYTETTAVKKGARVITHTLEFILEGVHTLPGGRWVALVEMNDGQKRLVGYSAKMGLERPLRVEKATASHGKNPGQEPRTTMTLSSADTCPAAHFTGEVEIV